MNGAETRGEDRNGCNVGCYRKKRDNQSSSRVELVGGGRSSLFRANPQRTFQTVGGTIWQAGVGGVGPYEVREMDGTQSTRTTKQTREQAAVNTSTPAKEPSAVPTTDRYYSSIRTVGLVGVDRRRKVGEAAGDRRRSHERCGTSSVLTRGGLERGEGGVAPAASPSARSRSCADDCLSPSCCID